jgi:hypothetical protein
MATPAPRKRKAAAPPIERTVKTSLVLGVELHTKLAAAAAMQGVDRNALVVEILTEALGGIVVFDRRKGADRVRVGDRHGPALGISPDDVEAA